MDVTMHRRGPIKVDVQRIEGSHNYKPFMSVSITNNDGTMRVYVDEGQDYHDFLVEVADKLIGRCHVCGRIMDPDDVAATCKKCGRDAHFDCTRTIPVAHVGEEPDTVNVCYNCIDAELSDSTKQPDPLGADQP